MARSGSSDEGVLAFQVRDQMVMASGSFFFLFFCRKKIKTRQGAACLGRDRFRVRLFFFCIFVEKKLKPEGGRLVLVEIGLGLGCFFFCFFLYFKIALHGSKLPPLKVLKRLVFIGEILLGFLTWSLNFFLFVNFDFFLFF